MSESVSKVRSGAASSLSKIGGGCPAPVRSPGSAPLRAVSLLCRADGLLSEAVSAGAPDERFRCAYVGALKGAAAVLAATEGRARSAGVRRPRSRSAWALMARAAPEFAEWADYFAEHSALRASIEAGVTRAVTDADADRFYSEVGTFLTAVEDFLGAGDRHDTREVSA